MIALSTAVTLETPCPRCGAQPGEACHAPSGKNTDYPHGERMQLYKSQHTEAELKARHTITKRNPFV